MKQLASALKELKQVLISICIVDSLLESLIVFLVFFLILTQFNLSWIYAIPFAVIYYVYRAVRLISRRDLVLVESKVPILSEKLRTAADYLGRSNEIIDSLNTDVIKLMKQIKTSYFISFKGLLRKLSVLFIVSILVIFISSLNVKLIDLKYLLSPLMDNGASSVYLPGNESDLIIDGDIYGEAEIIELGKEKLDLELSLVQSDVNIHEHKEFSAGFPKDIGAVPDASFEEDFSKEYKEIVKNYFDKISER